MLQHYGYLKGCYWEFLNMKHEGLEIGEKGRSIRGQQISDSGYFGYKRRVQTVL